MIIILIIALVCSVLINIGFIWFFLYKYPKMCEVINKILHMSGTRTIKEFWDVVFKNDNEENEENEKKSNKKCIINKNDKKGIEKK